MDDKLFALRLDGGSDIMASGVLSLAAIVIPALWALCALVSKRLHDFGWAGWHALWIQGLFIVSGIANTLPSLAPAAGLLGWIGIASHIALVVIPGTPGDNAYGPPTLASTPLEAARVPQDVHSKQE